MADLRKMSGGSVFQGQKLTAKSSSFFDIHRSVDLARVKTAYVDPCHRENQNIEAKQTFKSIKLVFECYCSAGPTGFLHV
jgi:hypothetical protein